MRAISLFFKGLFWGLIVVFTAPILFWLRPSSAEIFADYDDDDLGDDVDGDE